MNLAIIVGNLGGDVELRNTPSGTAVGNFSVATNTVYNDKDNKRQTRTEWHSVVVWGDRAKNCAQYLRKGSKVAVRGSLQTRSWDDKNGGKRSTKEIHADQIDFLDRKPADS